MEIILAENKENWDEWLVKLGRSNSFAQSFAWGELLIKEGQAVERLLVRENSETVAQAQIYYQNLPFGWRYAFCPQGPVSNNSEILDLLSKYFTEKKCVFFRIEPDKINLGGPTNFIIQKTKDINPRATLILDLNKTEDELLAGMHQKTRYNINLAGKKNLRLEDKKNLDVLMKLMSETGSRDKFKLHSRMHYREVLNSPLTVQLTAYLENEPVATVVLVGFGNYFTYLYGASAYSSRQLMAPYLLQWEAMKLGKKLGFKKYDFFGIAPGFNPQHQYAGVTRFKQGFGGDYMEGVGTHDLILKSNQYNIYRVLRTLRRIF